MDGSYALKYDNFSGDLLKYKSALCLCLTVYLKMHSIKIEKNELIPLIFQVKNYMTNKSKKDLKNEFHSRYCNLIENVVSYFQEKDLVCHILDNYGLAQLSLCNIVVQWITTKGEVIISKKEIDRIFSILFKYIKREYGEKFFELADSIGLYKKDEIKEIKSPLPAISNASIIIKNFHPNELNSSINAFILKDYQKYENYDIDYLKIVPCEKKLFIEQYLTVLNRLSIIDRMEKYVDKSRLDFFMEFKGDNSCLKEINLILTSMNKKPLINLDNEFQDIDLVIEKNNYLLKENENLSNKNRETLLNLDQKIKESEKLKEECEKFKDVCEKLKAEADILKGKAENLGNTLSEKKKEIKKMEKTNNDISTQLFSINVLLNQSNTKINNHLHRKICRKVEDYFYYIVSPKEREKIDKELKDTKKSKISIYIKSIEEEYPKYFKKIKNEGIDYSGFLYRINNFRKENNAECHDKEKVNYNSIIKTLNNYFEDSFDFKKHFDFMAKNFMKFQACLFDEKEILGEDVCDSFQKMENEVKI